VKNPLSEEDIKIIKDLLLKVKPDIIYAGKTILILFSKFKLVI
jgi:hypothetical protein